MSFTSISISSLNCHQRLFLTGGFLFSASIPSLRIRLLPCHELIRSWPAMSRRDWNHGPDILTFEPFSDLFVIETRSIMRISLSSDLFLKTATTDKRK